VSAETLFESFVGAAAGSSGSGGGGREPAAAASVSSAGVFDTQQEAIAACSKIQALLCGLSAGVPDAAATGSPARPVKSVVFSQFTGVFVSLGILGWFMRQDLVHFVQQGFVYVCALG
jgi:hypothetical protein